MDANFWRRKQARSNQMGPDWSLLPPELIQFVSEKTACIDEYYRFRAVCPAWRRACPPCPCPLPWLLFPQKERSSVYSCYDLHESKIRQFNLPTDTHVFVIGSSRGWFVLKKESELSLVNVVSGEIKSGLFPSLDAPPVILGFAFNEKTTQERTIGIGPRYRICKISLTCSPSEENCAIVASFYTSDSKWELAFCKVHDSCWTVLRLPERGRGNRHMMDFMCQNGLVYAIDDKCRIFVYDLRELSQKIMEAKLWAYSKPDDVYLVTGEDEYDGPLIVKHRHVHFGEEDRKVEVYKCYEYGQKYKYKRVKDIGNNVLILDNRSCLIFSCVGIPPRGWARNHIYYYHEPVDNSEFHNITLNMLNIENSNFRKVEYGSKDVLSVRSLCPTWLTHSLN